MAVILGAASADDANWQRLRSMPLEERGRLLANLRRFDLELTPEQQSSVRELDRRLSELAPEERDRYLAVGRRYRDWLEGLPENRQAEITSLPPGERMALVRKALRDRPAPTAETPPILRLAEAGEYSAFELAAAYRIWEDLEADQRAQVERNAKERARREALFKMGDRLKKKVAREIEPADFDRERWIARAQGDWRAARPGQGMDEAAKKAADEPARRRFEAFRHEVLRRQAINLYVDQARTEPVAPDRLARFIGALPEWVQASCTSLPPDVARRRAAFAYRLVFPHPEEIGTTAKPARPAAKASAAPRPRPTTPEPARRKPAPAANDEAPF